MVKKNEQIENPVMSRDEAIKYLNRKGEDLSEENIRKCMTSGKIFGDPVAFMKW